MSTFLVLLAPILIVILIGTAFSSDSLNNLKIGTVSQENNEISNSVLSNLAESGLSSTSFMNSEECIAKVKENEVHACIIFPEDLSIQGNDNPIIIHVDNSEMELAYFLIDKINAGISKKGDEIGLTMSHSLLTVLNQAKESLPIQKQKTNTAIDSLKEIESGKDEISNDIRSLNDTTLYLDSAFSLTSSLNGSATVESIKDEIDNARIKINSLNQGLDSNIALISSNSESAQKELKEVSVILNNLIQSLSAISIVNEESLIMPIKTEINPISKESNWKHLFPTLASLIILLSGIVLSSNMVITERKAKARFRNYLTPTSDFSFVIGTYLTCLIILLFQIILLFLGAMYLTGITIGNIIPEISLVLFLSSSIFIFLGMFIGYLFKSEETTILAGISIAAVLVFFSNAILPIESMSLRFSAIAKYNPLFLTDSLLRKAILFSGSPDMYELIIMGSILVGLFIATLVVRKITKRMIN